MDTDAFVQLASSLISVCEAQFMFTCAALCVASCSKHLIIVLRMGINVSMYVQTDVEDAENGEKVLP
eukprot:5468451-Amphidinium_carterae.1